MSQDLYKMMKDEGFFCAFQPIVCSEGRGVRAHELLIRCTRGQTNFSADVIVSEALRTNRIHLIDFFAGITALKQATKKDADCAFSFNASLTSILDLRFVESLITYSHSMNNLINKNVIIEITESEGIGGETNLSIIDEHIRMLRNEGFGIALDDFGCGENSHQMLQTVSADYVKFCHTDLLRSVNSSLRGNSRPFFVMKGMAAMVKGLGAKVVIEGVETGPCLHSARNLGADYMQGYLFGKPDETLISHDEFKGSDLELTFNPRLNKELLNATA